MRRDLIWQSATTLQSARYTCGYCGSDIASERGWAANIHHSSHVPACIYICHQCTRPTLIDVELGQTPGVAFGSAVADVPDVGTETLYNEARKTTASGSYTAAVLCCRKLLMHIAAQKGAKPGESFLNYVEFLAANNFIPPDARGWVDHIRTKSNEANHEIVIMSQADAEELIAFCEMLLKVIYEFPASIKRKAGNAGN